MQDASNLQVTAKARELAIEVYRASARFPVSERFGLMSQMRRSAVSIGCNIEEGCGRFGNRELTHFLHIALGSASELEFQAQIATDLSYLDHAVSESLLEEIGREKRMLAALIKSLRARPNVPSR